MTTELVVVTGPSPPELAEVANREHALARQAGESMLEHAFRAGEALLAAKAQVKHGEWLPWLEANFAASQQTASKYTRLAANYARERNLDDQPQSVRKALAAIAGPVDERKGRVLPPAPPLPAGEFSVLYCDPPWRYEHSETEARAVERQYPTMTLDELKALEVPAADDSILFMWATNPKLVEALELVEAWDFNYRTNAVWVKDRIGMGYYFRAQHELLLLAKRGDLPAPSEKTLPPSVVTAPRGKHSEKPGEVYELIEALYPDYARIELFARQTRDGWASWGNEVAT